MTIPANDWQRRLLSEYDELMDRIVKLDAFLHGPVFKTLDPMEQQYLTDQFNAMCEYSTALNRRIRLFKHKDAV